MNLRFDCDKTFTSWFVFNGTDAENLHTDRTVHADLLLQNASHQDSRPRLLNCLHEIGSSLSSAPQSGK